MTATTDDSTEVQPIDGDTDPARVLARAHDAMQLRKQGKTWDEVAAGAGYANKGSAYTAVMNYYRKHTAASAAALRDEANARHAQKLAMLEDIMFDPEQDMGHRLRAVMEHTRAEARHAAMNGLDAPVSITVRTELDEAIHTLSVLLAQREAAGKDQSEVVSGEVVHQQIDA